MKADCKLTKACLEGVWNKLQGLVMHEDLEDSQRLFALMRFLDQTATKQGKHDGRSNLLLALLVSANTLFSLPNRESEIELFTHSRSR